MFVFSVKTSRRQLVGFGACLLVLALIFAAALYRPSDGESAATVPAADGAARVAYLKSLGYEVDLAYCEVREVQLPDEADDTLLAYNALQQQAGMDLSAYYGQRLKCWSYRVLNAAAGETLAHLYVYKDTVVGGDITQTVQGGAVTALLPRTAAG